MEFKDQVFYFFKRLQELKDNLSTITYKDLGLELDPPVHFRHLAKRLNYIHVAIDIYNKIHETKLPHITALVIRKATKKPGVGCDTKNPIVVFSFDYEPYIIGLTYILDFILNTSLQGVWELEPEDRVGVLVSLLQQSTNLV